jgi:hypothetical protein
MLYHSSMASQHCARDQILKHASSVSNRMDDGTGRGVGWPLTPPTVQCRSSLSVQLCRGRRTVAVRFCIGPVGHQNHHIWSHLT